MARNWEDVGLTWIPGRVSRRHGANDSDKTPLGYGPIPQLTDTDKAIGAGLGSSIMAGVNGTSWRVTAQDVIRSHIEANRANITARLDNLPDASSDDALKERIFARLQGLRSAGVSVREVLVAPLPDGTQWKGNDVTEYEQLYAAGLVDAGVDAALALGIASKQAAGLKK